MLMCMWQIGKSNILYSTLRTKHSIITCSSALISQWGFFLNRPHREFEPRQNINLKLWCCKLTRSKVEVLKEYKPPLKQLIPQKSWYCPHPTVIKFLFNNSWNHIIIWIINKTKSSVACHISPSKIIFINTRLQLFQLSRRQTNIQRQKHNPLGKVTTAQQQRNSAVLQKAHISQPAQNVVVTDNVEQK